MSLLQLLLRPTERTLIDVVTKLPNLGVGAKVARKSWLPYGDSWWEITDVKLRGEDGSQGKVWGVLHWRGERGSEPRRIAGSNKRIWRWLTPEDEAARLAPLAAQLRVQQLRQRHEAAGGDGEGK